MALSPGSHLGPYEILAPLGAGGMGEVYRAKDPRLEREVAVKALPASFASDPDRLRRFEQEAETISCLSHPHIRTLYGAGNQDGTGPFFGPTLSSSLAADALLARPHRDRGEVE